MRRLYESLIASFVCRALHVRGFPSSCSSRRYSGSHESMLQSTALGLDKHQNAEIFVSRIRESLKDQTFVSATFRGPKKAARGSVFRIQCRPMDLKNTPHVQVTFKYHGATDIAKNWKISEVEDRVLALLSPNKSLDTSAVAVASEWGDQPLRIHGAKLETTRMILDLHLKTGKLIQSESKYDNIELSSAHDRVKQVPIDPRAPFLQALGVTNAKGKPRPGMSNKLRQCHKFVEVAGGLVDRALAENEGASQKDRSPAYRGLSVLDMGCGRGYLTFALHNYLSDKYDTKSSGGMFEVHSKGIDVRPKLIQEISQIAQGCNMTGLSFETGTIQSSPTIRDASDADGQNVMNVLIALHACDTATDDALWFGISSHCDIMVVAPCCHKQVRPQLDQSRKGGHIMEDIIRHGVYRERLAETVTDSLRALLLEIAGYHVKVFEFIGGEHTSKNVMITAVKRRNRQTNTDALRTRFDALAGLYAVRQQKLAQMMGVQVRENKVLSAGKMPPL